jgi:hypothetical protein
MDRVSTLLKKLQNQVDEKASARDMLQTVQILQAELMNKIEKKPALSNEKIAVVMPLTFNIVQIAENSLDAKEEEKVV